MVPQKAKLTRAIELQISDDASELIVIERGTEIFRLQAPPHAGFYSFEKHAIEGMCPIVSFDPDHSINGWQDWFYRVDVKTRSMERVNPCK